MASFGLRAVQNNVHFAQEEKSRPRLAPGGNSLDAIFHYLPGTDRWSLRLRLGITSCERSYARRARAAFARVLFRDLLPFSAQTIRRGLLLFFGVINPRPSRAFTVLRVAERGRITSWSFRLRSSGPLPNESVSSS